MVISNLLNMVLLGVVQIFPSTTWRSMIYSYVLLILLVNLKHFYKKLYFGRNIRCLNCFTVFSFSFPHGPATLLSHPSTPATVEFHAPATSSHIFCLPHFLPPSGQTSEAEGEPQGLKFPSCCAFSGSLFLFITWPPFLPLPWWWPRKAERQASLQD